LSEYRPPFARYPKRSATPQWGKPLRHIAPTDIRSGTGLYATSIAPTVLLFIKASFVVCINTWISDRRNLQKSGWRSDQSKKDEARGTSKSTRTYVQGKTCLSLQTLGKGK